MYFIVATQKGLNLGMCILSSLFFTIQGLFELPFKYILSFCQVLEIEHFKFLNA